jgi:hypothetical protein
VHTKRIPEFADLGIILHTGISQILNSDLIYGILKGNTGTTSFWHIIGKYQSITIHLKLKLFVNHA